MNAVDIIRQERVRVIGGYVLAAEAAVNGLLGADGLIDAEIGAIGPGGRRLKVLVVVAGLPRDVGQRVVREERFRGGVNGSAGDDWATDVGEVAAAVSHTGNQELLECSGRAAIAFVVGKEKGFVVAIVYMRDGNRAAQRAAKGVEVLGRFANETIGIGVEYIVLEVLKEAAVDLVAAALGGKGYVADLRELGAIVEGRDLSGSDSLLRGIGVLQSAVLAYVCRRYAVD